MHVSQRNRIDRHPLVAGRPFLPLFLPLPQAHRQHGRHPDRGTQTNGIIELDEWASVTFLISFACLHVQRNAPPMGVHRTCRRANEIDLTATHGASCPTGVSNWLGQASANASIISQHGLKASLDLIVRDHTVLDTVRPTGKFAS